MLETRSWLTCLPLIKAKQSSGTYIEHTHSQETSYAQEQSPPQLSGQGHLNQSCPVAPYVDGGAVPHT